MHEFCVVAVIVVFIVFVGGQHHEDRARREVVQLAPDHGADVQAVVGAVEVNALLFVAVVQHHVKAPRHGNDELMKPLVGVAATLGTTGYVVEVIDALDVKGYVVATFDECQVAAGIRNLRKQNYLAGINIKRHLFQASDLTFAGAPITVEPDRTSLVTTAPAPTVAPSPIFTPGSKLAPTPTTT